ncbi:hypothetical protein K8M07_10150 [Schnuerera sp. xch1]|uniref:DUF6873 family GME fold protein n=1 Tax=Schnuerera sp. xch1 TaxID=2874283 RepID=UPI001CBD4C15|nr:hypothetical protein [Schnuerera sp. xch1]MBZ2175596.1 hypothetical protein [Schnuerera sp. xch1]
MSENPFVPNRYTNTVIVDGRISTEMFNTLQKLNLKVVPTIQCKEVSESISYHPDIVLHPINHNTVIVAPNVFDYYKEKLFGMGIKIIKGETKLTEEYPSDIAYNIARVHNFAIHNFKYTDEKLKYYLKKENLEFIHVEQGYTKCSIAIISNKAIITADYPIYRKLTKLGIDSLLIEPGYIKLEGYPYGFIGGTCGNISKESIVFSGKLIEHPDRFKIIKFLKKYKKDIIYLSNDIIRDIGSLISLYCQ